jgi:clan AA aspartic protease
MIMTGVVTVGLQAKLDLEVFGPSGAVQKVETVIDTGFDGELILPPTLIVALVLASRGTFHAILADGKRVVLAYHEATVLWYGRLRTVEVLQSGGVALVGMELLKGSRLTLEASPGGAVTIEEQP